MTPDIDQAILRASWDDHTLADMLFMPVAMLRVGRRHLSKPVTPPPLPRKYRHALPSAPWEPDLDDWIMKAHDGGMCWREIAGKLGRTMTSVKSRARRIRGAKE